jgi:hypothetical protein
VLEIGTVVISAVCRSTNTCYRQTHPVSRNLVISRCIAVLFGTSLSWYLLLNASRTATNDFEMKYCSRGESVRFAYVTSLRVEGKEMHILCKANILPTQEMRQRAPLGNNVFVWSVDDSLSAIPPTPLIPVPFTSNGSQAHRFAPTTIMFENERTFWSRIHNVRTWTAFA